MRRLKQVRVGKALARVWHDRRGWSWEVRAGDKVWKGESFSTEGQAVETLKSVLRGFGTVLDEDFR